MSKVTLVSLLVSLLSLGLVTTSLVQSRRASNPTDGAGDRLPGEGGSAPQVNPDLKRELEAVKAELVELKRQMLALKTAGPAAKLTPEELSRVMDEVFKENERASDERHVKEVEARLNKESIPWIGSLTQKMNLSADQTAKVKEIVERQVAEGVRYRSDADGDREVKLMELSKRTDAAIQELLTETQKSEWKQTKKNWHKGRLGPVKGD